MLSHHRGPYVSALIANTDCSNFTAADLTVPVAQAPTNLAGGIGESPLHIQLPTLDLMPHAAGQTYSKLML